MTIHLRLPQSRNASALLALAAALVLFAAVNVIARNWLGAARLDLTQGGLYTLSPGTRATLAKIDEPITLRFYYSPQLGQEIPSYGVYADRVREMLKSYAARAWPLARGGDRFISASPARIRPTTRKSFPSSSPSASVSSNTI